jgi:trehalose 6-phosphate phosphatase
MSWQPSTGKTSAAELQPIGKLLVTFDPRDFSRIAILLDIDGTLLDIAPTPREVVVPRGLPQTLARVRDRVGGALALVSGRPIAEIDEFFAPFQFVAVGGHGAEMRPVADGPTLPDRSSPLDPIFRQRLKDIAANHPGVLVEDKGYSIALHYRRVPRQGVSLNHDVKHAYEAWADHSYELLAGKAVLEIKHSDFNKGSGVRQLMTYPPFQGRAPIFVGDDRTDEDAFDVMPEFKGEAMSVGRKLPHVEKHFAAPADVRHWLGLLAEPEAVSS